MATGFQWPHFCTSSLFPEDLLYLADFLLHLAGCLLGFAFAYQLTIPGDFPRNLFDTALHLVKFAFRFILRT